MDPTRRSQLTGAACAVTAAALFATKGVAIKWALQRGADATALLGVRMAVSLPCFAILAWTLSRGQTRMTRRELAEVAVLGLVGYHLASWLDVQGLRFIGVALERIILYIYPTAVVLLAWAMGRGRPGPLLLAAVGVTWAGVALSCHDQSLADASLAGVALVAGSAIAYAVHLVGIEPLTRRHGGARVAAMAMCAACTGVLVHAALAVAPAILAAQPAAAWQAGLILGLVGTVVPVLLAGVAVRRIGPGRFAVIGTVGPGVTVLLAWRMFGEVPSAATWVGFALTIAGGLAVGLAGQGGGKRREQLVPRPAPGVPAAVGAGPCDR